jgi:cyclophilin family peptidyl-prolyl cis-trans isomerase
MRSLFFSAALLLTAFPASASRQEKTTLLVMNVEGRGEVQMRLYPERAPKTVARILALVKGDFYDGLRFHRVDRKPKPYIAVVGDPKSKTDLDAAGAGGSGVKLAYEDSGLSNDVGAVGLAHPEDDPRGDSQFYIVLGPAQFLDGSYTVFGKVTKGMDVVQSLQRGDRVANVRVQ